MNGCVANTDSLVVRQASAEGPFEAREVEALEILRHIRVVRILGWIRPNIVDHVGLAGMEHCRLAFPAPTRIPYQSSLVAPSGFRFQIRISAVEWVAVIEVGISGNAKSATDGALEPPSVAE